MVGWLSAHAKWANACTGLLLSATLGGCFDFDAPANRVTHFVAPSHLADPNMLFLGTKEVELDGAFSFDSDEGTLATCAGTQAQAPCEDPVPVDGFETVQDGNDEIAVWFVDRFTVAEGSHIRVEGRRALAIVALNEVVIEGTIDVSAQGPNPGPGAARTVSCARSEDAIALGVGECGSGTEWIPGVYSGGGGGGHLGEGGIGGLALRVETSFLAEEAAGGEQRGDEHLDRLVGGGAGGAGGRPSDMQDNFPPGGGGGGALQLTSNVRAEVTASGKIVSNGGGGSAPSDDAAVGGGGGGGAGGLVVIEAPIVVVEGTLIATGGGGGGGDHTDDTSVPGAEDGEDGSEAPEVPAQGGRSRGPWSKDGGNGGGNGESVDGQRSQPSDESPDDAATGGGGGAAGRFVLKSEGAPETSNAALIPNRVDMLELDKFRPTF